MDDKQIKELVKEKYGSIASKNNQGCGCSCGCSEPMDNYSIMSDDYTKLDGYVADADLSLGCGVPTEFAQIKEGDVVVDLGSGAGNDVFIARSEAGETGKVIGVDMTEEMLYKANKNNLKMGYKNVEFRLGEIEDLPVEDNSTDVVISNCVLNLVPDKQKAFSEIHRILKPGAHFSISDIVLEGELPEAILKSAEMYAGCVAGALQKDDYLGKIKEAGFKNIEIQKSKKIDMPDEVLKQLFSQEDINTYRKSNSGIFSVTIKAVK